MKEYLDMHLHQLMDYLAEVPCENTSCQIPASGSQLARMAMMIWWTLQLETTQIIARMHV